MENSAQSSLTADFMGASYHTQTGHCTERDWRRGATSYRGIQSVRGRLSIRMGEGENALCSFLQTFFAHDSPKRFIVRVRDSGNEKTLTHQPLHGPFFRGTSLAL